MDDENKVSRQTVVILSILVVVISVLGTLTVMNEVSRFEGTSGNQAEGQIQLYIEEGTASDNSDGQATITIEDSDNQ